MKLKKEKSLFEYKEDKEIIDILQELTKDELIERYFFRMGKAVKKIKLLFIVGLILLALLLMSVYFNVECYYLISYLLENGII